MFKEFSLGCSEVGSALIREKEKLAEIATRCHSMSLDVTHLSFYERSIESALTEFKVYWKTDFSRCSYYKETKSVILLLFDWFPYYTSFY